MPKLFNKFAPRENVRCFPIQVIVEEGRMPDKIGLVAEVSRILKKKDSKRCHEEHNYCRTREPIGMKVAGLTTCE